MGKKTADQEHHHRAGTMQRATYTAADNRRREQHGPKETERLIGGTGNCQQCGRRTKSGAAYVHVALELDMKF